MGQAANNVLSFVDPYFQRCKLPHRQSSARCTRFARNAFRSTYRHNV